MESLATSLATLGVPVQLRRADNSGTEPGAAVPAPPVRAVPERVIVSPNFQR